VETGNKMKMEKRGRKRERKEERKKKLKGLKVESAAEKGALRLQLCEQKVNTKE
jgi:hypothetical protein